MLDNNTMITVINRDNGNVGYTIPDLGITRVFNPQEKKEITFQELRKLSYIPGGMYILMNCLIITNKHAINELLGVVEPEYFYTEKEVQELLLNGSLDQLEDCLNFAPTGTIELVKDLAVKLEIPDIRKRNMIQSKTGFNITKAIEINILSREDEEDQNTTVTRKSTPIEVKEKSTAAARKAATPKYDVVSIEE